MQDTSKVINTTMDTIEEHGLLSKDNACLLMVSGGSDSTALAYIAKKLQDAEKIGPLAMLHVNHKLRGTDADNDALFVSRLAESLGIPLFLCEIDINAEAARTGENIEAVARRERYIAADEALISHCQHTGTPISEGRILTAHTSDDRIENFYMRSIVGTGPGGFRSMLYRNGPVVRPLLDLDRETLRAFIASEGSSALADENGDLWREDATNAHTDRFRAYVRHNIVPVAKQWNPQMSANLVRTMNLIADEDDMVFVMAEDVMQEDALPLSAVDVKTGRLLPHVKDDPHLWEDSEYSNGFLLRPEFGSAYVPLKRRVVHKLLKCMLGQDERIDTNTVQTVLDAFDAESDLPKSGYVANIQGDLAVSANKSGVKVEHMSDFRARRKRK